MEQWAGKTVKTPGLSIFSHSPFLLPECSGTAYPGSKKPLIKYDTSRDCKTMFFRFHQYGGM